MFKKRALPIILSALMLVLLCSCGTDKVVFEKQPAKSSTGSSWSVFIYMCGGNTPQKVIDETFDELMNTDYSDNVNFIVQTGGREDWGIKGVDGEFNQRFVMQKKSMFLAGQTGRQNMASSDVLTDFVKWGMESYPADRYMLIINGQGGGAMNGAALDSVAGDILTLEDISYSMSHLERQVDIIGFDSSFMSSIETAAALANYANYMVASEEMMCPYGFDYEALGKYLVNNSEASVGEVCRKMCDDYYTKCDKYGAAESATIAVTDLTRTTELSQTFDGVAGMMILAMDDYGTASRMLRRLTYTQSCGARSIYEGYTDMTDLKNLAETIKVDVGATADSLAAAIDEIVFYSISGTSKPYVKGLGVYYPFSQSAESINKYKNITPSQNYLTYVRKACVNIETELEDGDEDYRNTNAYWQYTENIPNMQFTAYENNDGCYQLDIDTDMLFVKEIGLNLYSFDSKSGECIKLSTNYDVDGNLENTMFTSEFLTKTLSINGHNVCPIRTEHGYGFDVYSVPVILNGERASVKIFHTNNADENKFRIVGAWSGIDPENGIDKRNFRLLKTGDKIVPLFEPFGGGDLLEGKPFRIGITGARAGMSSVKGGIAYQYMIKDMYGNARFTDLYMRQ